MIEGTTRTQKWDAFYTYFMRTWMGEIDFETWNISGALEDESDIEHRTNNALENINQKFNAEFAVPHPNIFHFIDVLRKFSQYWVAKLGDLRRYK